MARRSHTDLTLVQLRYFVAASSRGSMTKAALDLHVAQSAVSTAIASLERTVGVQLFVRQRGRGLTHTAAGVRFMLEASSLLAQVDQMVDTVRGDQLQVQGTVRLACFVPLAPFVLPTLISRVERDHPRLRVEVIEADEDGIADLLRSGTVEGAITYDFGRLGAQVSERLFSTAPHVVLPAGDPLAAGPVVALSQLSDRELVLLDFARSREYFLGMLERAGVRPEIRYSSRSYETVRSLVAQGHGYSILNQIPRFGQTYDGGQVAVVHIADDVPALDVCLVRAAGVRETTRGRVIAALARELFETRGSRDGRGTASP